MKKKLIVMDEKFNITWQSFQPHIKDLMHDLYYSARFSDVTLIADDQTQFRVHKFVLSSCSSFFQNILNTSTNSPYIYLRGVAREDMESILQFVYLGQATLYQERMKEFLSTAKDLDIKEIGVDFGTTCKYEPSEVLSANKIPEESVLEMKTEDDVIVVNEEGKFMCSKCNCLYSHKKDLLIHIKGKHEGFTYPCKKCDYIACRPQDIRKHVKRVHEGVTYPCKHCDYNASDQSNLRRHIRRHHVD